VRRGGLAALALAGAAAACSHTAPRAAAGTPDELAATLHTLAGADEPTRQHAAIAWQLDEPTWNRTVIPAFRGLYADYVAGYATAIAPVVAALATHGTISARQHYAGDTRLLRPQLRTRWALPPLFPSVVAELDGGAIPAVFVFDGASWRALVGLDEAMLAHVRAADPKCADSLGRAGPPGSCTDVGYAVAAAALRPQHDGFAQACALAATLCANGSP
jgi:hypothetical protein